MKITQTWSDGSLCERSKRIIPKQNTDIQNVTEIVKNDIQQNKKELTKHLFSNRLIDQFEPLHSRDNNNQKREEVYMQIASREMFNKINQNPFLLGNNYVDDINVQEQFLRANTTNTSTSSNRN
jgi:hypothetical protein